MEIINKPEKIFLQVGDEVDFPHDEVINYDSLSEGDISFCSNRVYKSDLSYYSKELMFEFAEWIGINMLNYYNPKGATSSWFNTADKSLDCNTEQLFKKFLKDREE